jgi:amino acid transporter
MTTTISAIMAVYVVGLLAYFIFVVYGPHPWRRNRIGRSIIVLASTLELTFLYLAVNRLIPWTRTVRSWFGLGVFIAVAVALTYLVLSFRKEIREDRERRLNGKDDV